MAHVGCHLQSGQSLLQQEHGLAIDQPGHLPLVTLSLGSRVPRSQGAFQEGVPTLRALE